MRGEITINRATPIATEEYEFIAEFLKHERVNESCREKILADDPEFAEWFKAKK